ncbi:hypothetical protein TSUD_278470 [Trifolium subterraneum]|uniref:Endonuclease/exonuclease/phosphatase domain-containing protein n=1 Tax=Trifolium subterraneum TaxID=3900 RepID=A0A2Z6MME3_TRISU|nr:hypothetical protein TSUD_278470 [Trifolium subterraneum]
MSPVPSKELGQVDVVRPNIPRPPNKDGTPSVISSSLTKQDDNMGWDSEFFEDANDQGSVGTPESDMEIYITVHKPVMIVIVETRCDPLKLERAFNLLGYDGLVASDTQGFAGGGEVWYFTPVYASPNEEYRRRLWDELRVISNNMKDAWMLAGDFNDIACAEEKKGGANASTRKCIKFRERMNACQLLDMGAMGPKFTWRGPIYHGGQRIFERLDRALCNENWRLVFPDGYVKVLTRVEFSDHHPILISPKEAPFIRAPRQFRFESAWLLDNTYNSMLNASWKRVMKEETGV